MKNPIGSQMPRRSFLQGMASLAAARGTALWGQATSPGSSGGRYAAPPNGTRSVNARNLDYFDAIFFYGLGEEELSDSQKQDLLSFVHEDGKGFVGAHSAIDAFYSWPEYGEIAQRMAGGTSPESWSYPRRHRGARRCCRRRGPFHTA